MVSAIALVDSDDKVLIGQRPDNKFMSGYWEFPGGKLEEKEKAEDPNVETIKSPMVGTFYRAPSPDSANFTDVGKKVDVDSIVCIIEAMKVMNEIQAEVKGTITEILVEDGDAIEFGQPLFKYKKA